jgi:DNA-binding SARP family transcriptional activator/predicted ATPase
MMAELRLTLFGKPQVHSGAVAIDPQLSAKSIALLAYLAVTRQAHSRQALAGLFWGELPESTARANLRLTLSRLRKAVGDALTLGGQSLAFDFDQPHWVDVLVFEGAATDPAQVEPTQLQEAVELYRRPFLDDFALNDAPEFETWVLMERERLHQLARRTLLFLADRAEQTHDLAASSESIRRLLVLEPWNEEAHYRLIWLLAHSGERSAALQQYERCRQILADELGVEPGSETVALYKLIRRDEHDKAPWRRPEPLTRQDIAATPVRSPAASPAASLPRFTFDSLSEPAPATFVARQSELAWLDEQLQSAVASHGRILFVTGEAGEGKTALLQAFAHRAERATTDLVVAGGACNAYTGMGDPFLPFRQILELLAGDIEAQLQAGDLRHEQARRLWQTMPATAQALVTSAPDLLSTFISAPNLLARFHSLTPPRPHAPTPHPWLAQLERSAAAWRETRIDPMVQQSSLFEQYTRVLQTLAQQTPLLILLDDLQWADQGSVSLLFHLGRRLSGQRILIVGAYRPIEVALGRQMGGAATRHPLEPVIHELQREHGEIFLNLGRHQDRALVDALLDSEPNKLDESFRSTLFHQTGGHALFTVELLRGMQERGDLALDNEGAWVAQPSLDWETLPARIDAVIAERTGRLDETLRELLRVASVEGETFTAEVSARMLGLDEREVVRRLSGALAREHRLVRATGVHQGETGRRSQYRFSHFLIQRHLYSSLDEAERAYLHEGVGAALEALYGGRTQEVDVQLAHHFQEAGLWEKSVRYLKQAGDLAQRLSANLEAVEHYRRALALLARLPDSRTRQQQELALQIALSIPLQLTQGFPSEEARLAFERALALGRALGHPPEFFPLLGRLAHLQVSRAQHRVAQATADELMRLAYNREEDDILLEAYTMQGICAFYQGNFVTAQTNLSQELALYDFEKHHELTYVYGTDPGVHVGLYLMHNQLLLGYPDRAQAQLDETLALAERTQHPHTIAFALSFATLLDVELRRIDLCLQRAAQTVALCEQHGFPMFLALSKALYGWALAQLGEVERGLAEFAEARTVEKEIQAEVMMPLLLTLLAEIIWRHGDVDAAAEIVDQVLVMVEVTDERFAESQILYAKGALQLAQGGHWSDAAIHFQRALATARQQQARTLELRIARQVYALAQDHAPVEARRDAHDNLAAIVGWFDPGLDEADLQAARAALHKSAS